MVNLWKPNKNGGYIMYRKILLPTDGSENAKRAGKHAIWLADASGADIIVLNVIEPYYPQISALPNFREGIYDDLRDEGKNVVESFRKDLEFSQCNGECKTINLSTKIKEGKPYNEILEVVDKEEVDLIVMGASGRHGLDKFMLGSVTERVMRASKCPVMVVP
jgi:nucleotide-binding universal stress UspA family protein